MNTPKTPDVPASLNPYAPDGLATFHTMFVYVVRPVRVFYDHDTPDPVRPGRPSAPDARPPRTPSGTRHAAPPFGMLVLCLARSTFPLRASPAPPIPRSPMSS